MLGVAVCEENDPVIGIAGGIEWLRIDTGILADQEITVGPGEARLDGRPISALYWSPPLPASFSESFEEGERPFVDHETLAVWSAVAAHPGMRCNVPGTAFHNFATSRWLCLSVLARRGGVRECAARFGGAGFWMAHCATGPERVDAAHFLGAATCDEAQLAWYCSGDDRAFALDPSGDALDACAAAVAGLLSRNGYKHAVFALGGEGGLAAAYPWPGLAMASNRGSRRAAAETLAAWYAA